VLTLKFLLPFSDRLLKSDLLFYINAIKKSDEKKKSLPTNPIFFSNKSGNTTLILLGLMYYYYKIPYFQTMFSFHFRLYGLSKISADIYNGAPLRTLVDNLKHIFFFLRDISSFASVFLLVSWYGGFLLYICPSLNFLSECNALFLII